MKNKEKEAGNGPFLGNKVTLPHSTSIFESVLFIFSVGLPVYIIKLYVDLFHF